MKTVTSNQQTIVGLDFKKEFDVYVMKPAYRSKGCKLNKS